MQKLFSCTFLLFALLLSACSSTSKVRDAQRLHDRPDLSSYNDVIVDDFKDGVSKTKNNPDILKEGKIFADIIAHSIKAQNYYTKVFNKIERNVEPESQALLIDGEITQYAKGNAAARLLLGWGAGSSHFDAKVYIRDAKTQQVLFTIKIDKMSWVLGGVIAASQDVKAHMDGAGAKIAKALIAAKITRVHD
jgi:hypothetical protein